MGYLSKDEKKELKKHAATIHCSNTLSLLQRKITNALLYHAYKELMIKDEHEITVKQLCRLIGYQGNNHSVIKEALRGLISTVIEWNLINDVTGTENWTASSIIASVSLDGPLCYYAYSPRMKQLLHSPSMFGKIDLVIQSHFRSSYGLALYENCSRYRGLPNTKWFDMDLFKKLMGVPMGKYDVFRDFKRRVLDKAVDEVNTYSDLFIEADYVREGRKTVKVRFKLKERARKTRLGGGKKNIKPRLPGVQDELRAKLYGQFGLTEEQVEQVLTEYDTQFVLDKIAVVEASKPYQDGKVQSLAGYLLSAVKNNYHAPKAKQSKVIDMEHARKEIELAELKRYVEEIRSDYMAFREKSIHTAIDQLPENEKQRLMTQFAEFAEPVISTILQLQRNRYTRENVMESPQVKALLRRYAVRELDFFMVPSIEEFILQLSEDRREAWQKLRACDPDHIMLQVGD